MLKIGLTGGIASGKSSVVRFLLELGAPVIDADQLARAVVEPGAEAYDQVVAAFGQGILLADGRLNRPALANIVFADPTQRGRLEAIVHPAIHARRDAVLTALLAQQTPAVVLDIPLLIELGLQHTVDRVWLVYVDAETQLRRLMSRDGSDEAAARRRIAAQMPLEAKLTHATAVIDNRGSLAETRIQVVQLWRAALAKAGGD